MIRYQLVIVVAIIAVAIWIALKNRENSQVKDDEENNID